MLAILNMTTADAAISCWRAKYGTAYWRPSTAIQLADTDGNPATTADPTWTPLVANPPYPDYPSGHACLTGATANGLCRTRAELGRVGPILIPRGGPRPWGSYQQSRARRCAERRFPRSLPTVGGEVMRSNNLASGLRTHALHVAAGRYATHPSPARRWGCRVGAAAPSSGVTVMVVRPRAQAL